MHAWNALRAGFCAVQEVEPFEIRILSGTGYAGSTYLSTRTGGNWYADETPISGATGATHVMLAENEGKAITYRYSSFTSNAITMWTPASISGLVAWFDASAETTITQASTLVSQINSRGGSAAGLNAAQATSANRPSWSATARNNKPGLVYPSTLTYLQLNSITGLPGTTATSVVAGVAFLNASAGSYRALFSWGPTSGSSNRTVGKGPGNFTGHYGSTSSLDYVTAASWVGVDKIVIDTVTNTAGEQYVDGVLAGSKSWTYNTIAGGIGRIGCWTTGTGQFWYGVIQEILVFSATLSSTDREKLEGYFASKWDLRGLLNGAHPYKSTNPT